jgi:hypothetical protein
MSSWNFHHLLGLYRHLNSRLPELMIDEYVSGCKMSASFAANLWSFYGNPQLARVFEVMYSMVFEPTMVLSHLPILDDREKFPPFMETVVMLEAMRQALATGEGLACLCPPEMRRSCGIKDAMLRFARLVQPEEGYEDWFSTHWREPACSG